MIKHCYFFDTNKKDQLIFSIVSKLFQNGEKVIIYTSNEERAYDLDRFLWVYKQESFIPHKIFKYEEKDALEPVAIVMEEFVPIDAKNLILDNPASQNFATQFDVIYDFVDHSSEKTLQQSRIRYKTFKSLGYVMHYKQTTEEVFL